MARFNTQYIVLFFLTWILLFLIIPTWTLPLSVSGRAFVYFGLTGYFCISAAFMKRWVSDLTIDKPVIVLTFNWRKHFKDNLWLIIVCSMAVLLQIYPLLNPILIIGDEALHLQSGFWVYEYIDIGWHNIFQAVIWIIIALLIILRIFKERLNRCFSYFANSGLFKYMSVLLFFSLLVVYFLLLKDVNYVHSLIRYPPLSKVIYFLTYSAFGINHIFPRIIQLIFYILCSIYLYRTIHLFYEKETALIGATIYLFLPISFAYAHLGELASGTIFMMAAVSFYFLRFIKGGDDRDLIITAYLIGIACMYKKLHLLMYIVCLGFMIGYAVKNSKLPSMKYLKILSLSMVPIIPWMVLTKNYSWRNYTFISSNFTSLDSKIITYFSLMLSNISAVFFIAFLASVIYVCIFRRNTLTYYFGLLFIVYYFFIVSDSAALSPRFSMAFYPTVAVFLSIFISRIVQLMKWKHAFNVCLIFLTLYLIVISSVSPLNNGYLDIMDRKLIYFPSGKAMQWVKENVKEGEKIVTLRIMSSKFYRIKHGIDENKIIDFWYEIDEVSTPDKLRAFYSDNNISYIMFPYSPDYPHSSNLAMLQYLKNNRDKEFVEVEKFNLDDNFIFIYKVKRI